MRRALFFVVAIFVLVGGAAAVAATQSPAKSKPRATKVQPGFISVAAQYLGLTNAQLRQELRGGRSLAQVATARGKSVDGLEQALFEAFRARVDRAVAAGRFDAARAQRLLERAPVRIERLVNAAFRLRARGAKAFQRGLLAAAAQYLGLTRPQLAAELRGGRSLAQVAAAHGNSVDGLKQALFDRLKTRVDRAVAAGRLDAARAQRLLERAPARIERLVNRTRR